MVNNKLLTYQDKRYRYDGFGRMIEKRSALRGVQLFAYDAEHRLIEVRSQKDGRETVVKMTYDPLGRRIAKTEHDSNGYPLGETRFDWEGLRLLQEHRHSQTSLYLYEEDGYIPLARVDGTGEHQSVRYYHNDLNGLPEQLTEADGKTVWQARYQVWGNADEEVREAYFIEEQNLRFQGQYLDREIGLHYNTFRFYDPDVGRFTTPDPIGLMGGFNLYQYAPNPIGWIDPWGWAGDPAKATHITYVGVKDGKPYVGYASKPGLGHSAQAVLDYRYPNKQIFDVAPEAVFKGDGQKGKDIARGLEQRIYEDKLKEGPVANKQRPVGPNNKRRDIYLAAADKHRGVKPQKSTKKFKGPGRC